MEKKQQERGRREFPGKIDFQDGAAEGTERRNPSEFLWEWERGRSRSYKTTTEAKFPKSLQRIPYWRTEAPKAGGAPLIPKKPGKGKDNRDSPCGNSSVERRGSGIGAGIWAAPEFGSTSRASPWSAAPVIPNSRKQQQENGEGKKGKVSGGSGQRTTDPGPSLRNCHTPDTDPGTDPATAPPKTGTKFQVQSRPREHSRLFLKDSVWISPRIPFFFPVTPFKPFQQRSHSHGVGNSVGFSWEKGLELQDWECP